MRQVIEIDVLTSCAAEKLLKQHESPQNCTIYILIISQYLAKSFKEIS